MLEISDLSVRFGPVRAVDGVSLQLAAGPFGLGLVGESGSGKTTIGRAVLRLARISGGQIRFEGTDLATLRGRALQEYRRAAQIVFQDPDNSLDPRMRIGASIREALAAHRVVPRRAGGRAGRGPARRGGAGPGVRVPVPAPAVRRAAPARRHRPRAQRAAAAAGAGRADQRPGRAGAGPGAQPDRPAAGRAAAVLPAHHAQLRDRERAVRADRRAVPGPDRGERPDRAPCCRPPPTRTPGRCAPPCPRSTGPRGGPGSCCPGDPPDAASPPPGCVFHPRCPLAVSRCRTEVPLLRPVAPGRQVACHRAEEVLAPA